MDWITDAINKILEFFYALFRALIDALKDIAGFVFDQLLTVVNKLLESILASLSAIPMPDNLPLPAGVSWVLSQIGVPQMLVIVSSALIIRVLLQLIPFVRLGS